MKQVLIYILLTANIVSLVHLGFFLAGANFYDVRALRRAHRARKLLQSGVRPRRSYYPLVSVIVPAHNEETGIVRTLDSLRLSSYSKVEIIVVDDGSTDKTAQVVRNYITKLPMKRTSSKLVRRSRVSRLERLSSRQNVKGYPVIFVHQKNGGKGSAVNNGIKNYARGTLVMCLDADSLIHPEAIANTVKHFQDRQVIGVAANVRIMGKGWLGTLQRFEHMIGYRSKKFYTVTNSEFIVGGVASTYRKSVLKKVGYYDTDTQTEDIGLSMKLVSMLGNRDKRIIYASDVVAMTEGVLSYRGLMKQRYRWKLGSLQNMYKYRKMIFRTRDHKYSKMLTIYRLPVALLGESLLLLEPILLSYVTYLSFHKHSPAIFLGAYATITAYTLWTIWPDEHMTAKQKLRMSGSAFVIYLLFYAMTFVQLMAIYKCLRNYRKIVDLSNASNTWVSPKRSKALQPGV